MVNKYAPSWFAAVSFGCFTTWSILNPVYSLGRFLSPWPSGKGRETP